MTRDDDAHDQTDAELLEELAKLRAAAVAEPRQSEIIGLLIAGWYDRFFGYLASHIGTQEAEEVASRVELRLVRLLLRECEFSAAWGAVVWRTVHDEAYRFYQQREKRKEFPVEEVYANPAAEPFEDPLEELFLDPSAEADRFTKLVEELSERDQLVIKMRVIDDVPRNEVAEALGINENAVDQARSRAIIRLAKLAKERGVSRPDESDENEA
ncbi:MAG: RNA polymerase sigma factor [Candidatus Binataceae bacterium]